MAGTTPGTSKKTKTLIVAGVLTLVTSSQGIFTTASKVDGKYEYNFGTIVLLAEAVSIIEWRQLLASLFVFW